jgi:hypothetical protein
MPSRPQLKPNFRNPNLQQQVLKDKVDFSKPEAQTGRVRRPVLKVAQAGLQQRVSFIAPEHDWILAAAERAVQLRPRPNQLHVIRNFKKVSYGYANIVMGFVGRYKNPVEAFMYQCLLDRLEAARVAMVDPGSELHRLQEKADKRGWPTKVFQRKRRVLEVTLSGQRQDLDLCDLFILTRQMFELDGKKRSIEVEIKKLWHGTKKRKNTKKPFSKRNQELQDRLRVCKDAIYNTKLDSWEAWLDQQAVKIFHEIEADIVHMAQYGRLKRVEQPKGRSAVRAQTRVWRSRQVVVIAELEECRDGSRRVYRVVAVVSPSAYRNKQNKRIKPQKTKYHNCSLRSQRTKY